MQALLKKIAYNCNVKKTENYFIATRNYAVTY